MSCQIQRVDGDQLRIEIEDDLLRFESGADVTVTLRGNSDRQHAGQSLQLQCSLYRVSDSRAVSTQAWPVRYDAEGNSDPITHHLHLPLLDGVYEVRAELAAGNEPLWSKFKRRENSSSNRRSSIDRYRAAGCGPYQSDPSGRRDVANRRSLAAIESASVGSLVAHHGRIADSTE